MLSSELLGLWSEAHNGVFPWTLQAALSVLSLSVLSVHMGPLSLANLIPLDRMGATRPRKEIGPHSRQDPMSLTLGWMTIHSSGFLASVDFVHLFPPSQPLPRSESGSQDGD